MRSFLVLLFTAAPAFVAAASADPNNLSLVSMTLKMLASLGVVVGLFLLLYALVRKSRTLLPGADTHDSIQVRAVRHLGPKRSLYLVDVDGHRFFISAAAEQIRLLSEWDAPPTDPGPGQEKTAASFATDKRVKTSFAAMMQRQFKGGEWRTSAKGAEYNKSKGKKTTTQADSTTETQEDKSCPEA